jgi:hypothetical protein
MIYLYGTILLFAQFDNTIVGMAGARIEKTLKKGHIQHRSAPLRHLPVF